MHFLLYFFSNFFFIFIHSDYYANGEEAVAMGGKLDYNLFARNLGFAARTLEAHIDEMKNARLFLTASKQMKRLRQKVQENEDEPFIVIENDALHSFLQEPLSQNYTAISIFILTVMYFSVK